MKVARLVIGALTIMSMVTSQAQEIRGTPEELRKLLKDPPPPTMNITGEGKVRIQADRAIATIQISTEHRTLKEALHQNDTTKQFLQQTLVAKGIPVDRISVAKFSSVPEMSRTSDKVKTYEVNHTMKVTVMTAADFRSIAEAIDGKTEASLQSVVPEHITREDSETEALLKAFEDAKRKQAIIEKTVGLKLVPRTVPTVATTPTAVREVQRNMIAAVTGTSKAFLTAGLRENIAIGAPEVTITGFGEISYNAAVVIEFDVHRKE